MLRLEMVVPVYVMFTKADLIAGFVEFWRYFSKTQRGKVWGATFAREDDRLAEPARAFEDEFDCLLKVLHSRMLTRLSGERVPQVRSRVLQFPLEFQALRAPLAKFIEELCRTNPFNETPICADSTSPAARRWEDRSTRCSPTWCEGSISPTRQASHR